MYLKVIKSNGKTYYLLVVYHKDIKIEKWINKDLYNALKSFLKSY